MQIAILDRITKEDLIAKKVSEQVGNIVETVPDMGF